MKLHSSISVRMMVVIGAVTALAMLIFSGIVMSTMEAHFEELDELRLNEIRAAFAYEARTPEAGLLHVAREHPTGAVALVRDGRVVAKSPAAPVSLLPTIPAADEFAVVRDTLHHWRVMKTTEPDGAVLYCFIPMDAHLAFHETVRMKLAAALAVLMAAVLVAVWWTVRRGLAPVRELGERMNRMSAEKMESGWEDQAVPAELTGFAEAFRRLLTRLSDVLARQRQFSADIAHELKTPVTNLTVQTEVALARPRSNEELENVLYSSLEEYRRLSKMIEDMLFLARIDNEAQVPEKERFELTADIADLVDFFSDWADERGVTILPTGAAQWVTADRLMVRRAVTNLITNAAKHTATGGVVTVATQTSADGKSVTISVANPGSPIDAEHLPHLFDRFYRADASRTRQDGGTGIGLAMVASIARLHGGSVAVTSDKIKTVFSMTLPLSA